MVVTTLFEHAAASILDFFAGFGFGAHGVRNVA